MKSFLKMLVLSVVLVLSLSVNAAFAMPVPTILQGMCDASALLKVGSQFLVLNDEDKKTTFFRLFDFSQGGEPTVAAALPTKKLQIDPDNLEIDFEGLTQIKDVYFAIGSHSRDSKYKPSDSRKNLVAFRWQSGVKQPIEVLGSLKHLIPALQAKLKTTPAIGIKEIDPASNPKQEDGDGGLSIEGLAAMSNGNLLLGLRSPTNPSVGSPSSRQALAVELVDPLKAVTTNQATLGNVYLWQLDGAGIRDLTYDAAKRRILVLSGPPGSGNPFKVWTWAGDTAQPKQVLPLSQDQTMAAIVAQGGAPEGLTIDGDHLWIVFDEGKRKVKDKECKDLSSSDTKKTFHAVSVPYNF